MRKHPIIGHVTPPLISLVYVCCVPQKSPFSLIVRIIVQELLLLSTRPSLIFSQVNLSHGELITIVKVTTMSFIIARVDVNLVPNFLNMFRDIPLFILDFSSFSIPPTRDCIAARE